MNIPNIPSDNLYKFIALASLVTLILSIYFLKSLQYEMVSDLINLNGEGKHMVSLQKELVDDLNLTYNGIRQEAITKEILDISTAAISLE